MFLVCVWMWVWPCLFIRSEAASFTRTIIDLGQRQPGGPYSKSLNAVALLRSSLLIESSLSERSFRWNRGISTEEYSGSHFLLTETNIQLIRNWNSLAQVPVLSGANPEYIQFVYARNLWCVTAWALMSEANALETAAYGTVSVKTPETGHEARANTSKKNRQTPVYRKHVAEHRARRTITCPFSLT